MCIQDTGRGCRRIKYGLSSREKHNLNERCLSRELLIRDVTHGKSASEAMTNFAQNLFYNHDLEIE